MYLSLLIFFFGFLLVGLIFNYLLFLQDIGKTRNTTIQKICAFMKSNRFYVFIVEIMIAVLGFGLTLSVTNYNERQMEKDKAIQMIGQVIEFTDRQIEQERSYLVKYNNGKITSGVLRVSNVINLDYYRNILSTEVILQNVNMVTYGNIMTYIEWIEQRDLLAKDATGSTVYTYMYQRYTYLRKMRDLLCVCHEEFLGYLTPEEALKKCSEIRSRSLEEEIAAAAEATLPSAS